MVRERVRGPGLARQDDPLLVLFDKGVRPRVVPVTLDTVALRADPCGCAARTAASAWPTAVVAVAAERCS